MYLVCTAKLRELETAFHSSEFYRLVVEATDDSLSRALDLFGVPGGVDISLRGRLFSPPSFHEVDGDEFALFALGRRQHFRHLPTAVFVGGTLPVPVSGPPRGACIYLFSSGFETEIFSFSNYRYLHGTHKFVTMYC